MYQPIVSESLTVKKVKGKIVKYSLQCTVAANLHVCINMTAYKAKFIMGLIIFLHRSC